MHPKFVLRSLKTIGKAVRMLYSHTPRCHLLQLLVATFLLHLGLTALLVKIASPAVNLDSMAPFYEIEDNSTAAASQAVVMPETATVDDKATETSPPWLWKLELLGELFWRLTLIITIFGFSKVIPPEDTECLRNAPVPSNSIHGTNYMVRQGRDVTPGPLTWREVKSLALVVFNGQILAMFAFVLLEESGLDDHLRKLTDFIGCVHLVTVVVISSEGLHGFDAIDRAWELVVARYGDVSVFGATFVLTQGVLEYAWRVTFSQGQKKEVAAAAVIREDTAAEMLHFSLVAAFVAVIMQLFACSVILAFYKESTICEQHRSKAVVYEIKKIQRLAREFASVHPTSETEVFKQELLKHTRIALEYMGERRPREAAMVQEAPGTSPSRGRRAVVEMQMERTGQQDGARRGATARARRPTNNITVNNYYFLNRE